MGKIAIGIDIGTTQTKAVGFDEKGTVQASAYVGYPLIQETEGMAEQSLNQIMQAVVTCIRQVVDQVAPQTITLLSFSTAMHGLIVMDQYQQPLTRLITWADNRAEKAANELKETTLGQTIYQQTGLPMHPMTPFQKIRWLKAEHPEIYEQAAYFIGIKEYIMFHFFGEYLTDISTASGTGYLNIHTLTWDDLALKELAISEKQLPKLVSPTQQLIGIKKEWQEKLGVPNETLFVLGGADGPLSNLGLGALEKGTATLTVGTSGAIRYIVDRPIIHPDARTFCFVLDEAHWVIGGASSNGAGIFDWACQTLLKETQLAARQAQKNPYEAVLTKVAEVPVGANGILFHPYLLGERAPLWEAEATGSFLGLKRHHDDRAMMRAVIEGICLNLCCILAEIETVGPAIREIRATGGFVESAVFKQIMADVLGQSLLLTDNSEASALGAVMIGWKSLNKTATLEEACQLISTTESILPNKVNHQLYQLLLPLYQETQQQVAASYQQLAQLRRMLADTLFDKATETCFTDSEGMEDQK